MHANVIDLDKEISVQPHGKYSAFLEGVDKLMFYICHKLKPTGLTVRPKRTGSLYAGLKVGLPLETDYVYIIEDLNGRKLNFSNFIWEMKYCLGNIEYIKYKNAHFKILQTKRTRVAYCLTIECRDVINEVREGFSVDIVPAYVASESDTFKIKYRDGAEDFIRNCEIESDAYPISLLSTGRDSPCDLGLIKHSIFKSLDDDTRRALRAAKHLAIYALRDIRKPSPIVSGLDDTDSKRLLGYSLNVSSSFYLCGIFLHILIAAHKSNRIDSLKNGVLTLCTLHLLKRTFEFFSNSTHRKYMHDPLVAGLNYFNHLNVENYVFHECARRLDDTIDEFLEGKQLDIYNLRIFERADTDCDR